MDLDGVALGPYSQDLAYCTNNAAYGVIDFGNKIAECMRAKGYKILVAN